MKFLPSLLLPALLASAIHAGEFTVDCKPFTIEQSFRASVLPSGDVTLLQVEPKSWQDFQITAIAPHGSRVAKGETLVRFDAETIDRQLADTQQALATGALKLAQAELELKHLQETAPHELDAHRRAAAIAKEEHDYFVKTRRKATEEAAAQKLERQKQTLENQQEELTQLTKMYEADDLTEATEEIILTRQKDDVAAAEFELRMGTLAYHRTLEVNLPREAVTLANSERDTAIELLKAEQEIPRSIELKKLEIEALKTERQRQEQNLAELKHDRALFEIKAPGDGWFYHGPIVNGRWLPDDLAKTLIVHGRPPVNRPFATFVSTATPLGLVAFVNDSVAHSLQPDATGIATVASREDIEIPVKLNRLQTTPETDGTYRADLSATWPENITLATGSRLAINLIAYHKDSAMVIPNKALSFGPKGWTAEVKLADGKTERRAVKRGRISGDEIEILSGLEPGQVIIVP